MQVMGVFELDLSWQGHICANLLLVHSSGSAVQNGTCVDKGVLM